MSDYYLAVDMGASSGRLILGHLDNGKLVLNEMHRFENQMIEKDNELYWDYNKLFNEIKIGLKKCKDKNKFPKSMGVDTWGVDFALVKNDGELTDDTFAYRSDRTINMDVEVQKIIPDDELYRISGIQKAIYNSIYQLMAVKKNNNEALKNADRILFVPDYFNYLLTGKMTNEYTHATTSQLIDPNTKKWNYDLIERLGFPKKLFQNIVSAGTVIGNLKDEVAKEIGDTLEVIAVASHDTASAVLAVPSVDDDFIFLSSGTWSLMGVESDIPNCSSLSQKYNFTNEGGYNYRYRFIKNIMGLWIIQSVRHELNDEYNFSQIVAMAEEKKDFPSIIDVNDDRFLNPTCMIDEIKNYCMETNQKVPSDVGEIATVVYKSLADCYAKTVKQIEELKNHKYKKLHIVGGGSNAEYLNKLTALSTGKEVFAGPSEGTAIGNIMAQMIHYGDVKDIHKAREIIFNSFDVKSVK